MKPGNAGERRGAGRWRRDDQNRRTAPGRSAREGYTTGEIHEASLPHQEWSWVEPRVWTARMLAALEKRVKGGKWYSLDNVYPEVALRAAFTQVAANSGAAGWIMSRLRCRPAIWSPIWRV